MSDVTQELRRINWGECFGFTQVFRAFRLAIHPTKLILAFCGVLLTYGTGHIMDVAWPTDQLPVVLDLGESQRTELDYFVKGEREALQGQLDGFRRLGLAEEAVRHQGAFKALMDHARATTRDVAAAVMAANPRAILPVVKSGLMAVLWLLIMHPVYAIIFFLITLVIWALFGGAICRVAALHAAREERIGLRESLAFARQKFLSFLAAPLMPLGISIALAVPLYIGGFVGAIPFVGDILASVFFFFALCAGFAMAFVLVGGLTGFPLTYPTIAIEGSDAFDALSRSFSYVYQRPWRTALYVLLSIIYGAICLVFVKFFVRLMFWVVHFFVGLSMNLGKPALADGAQEAAKNVGKLDALWQSPSLTKTSSAFWGSFPGFDLANASAFAQFWFYLWIFVVVGFVAAFVVSFYFSSSTLIYFLLRREVDATDLEDVYITEQPEAAAAPLPAPAATIEPQPEPGGSAPSGTSQPT